MLTSTVKKYLYRLLLSSVVILAFLIRLHQLGLDQAWVDEAFTGFISLNSNWLNYILLDPNPPLYYLIQKIYCSLFICNTFGLRVSSVFFGTAYIAILIIFTGRYLGNGTALLIGLFAALSPIHIFFSQEARCYSMLMTLLLVFLVLQHKIVNKKEYSPFVLFLFFLISSLALLTHYFAGIVILCCAVIYLFESKLKVRVIPGIYYLTVLLSFAPLATWLLLSSFELNKTVNDLAWIKAYSDNIPLWRFIDSSISVFLTGSGDFQLTYKRYNQIEYSVLAGKTDTAVIIIFITLFIVLLVKKQSLSEKSELFEWAAFTVMPLAVLLILSVLYKPVYTIGRYDLIAYPSFTLLLGFIAAKYFSHDLTISNPIKILVVSLFFTLIFHSQIIKIYSYKNITPLNNVSIQIDKLVSVIKKDDLLIINRRDAVVAMYYLAQKGYRWDAGKCKHRDIEFYCALFPENMEAAPAAAVRYEHINSIPKNELEVGFITDNATGDSAIFLYIDYLYIRGKQININSINLKLLHRLLDEGLEVDRLYPDFSTILLQKK